MEMKLSQYAEAINNAFADGVPCVMASTGEDGLPDIGLKGSMMVFDDDHLAYWERTLREHLANLRRNPGVAVLYFNGPQRQTLRFFGRAELHESGPVRDAIMARTIEQELSRDPERNGIGVLIRVDKLIGSHGRGTVVRE